MKLVNENIEFKRGSKSVIDALDIGTSYYKNNLNQLKKKIEDDLFNINQTNFLLQGILFKNNYIEIKQFLTWDSTISRKNFYDIADILTDIGFQIKNKKYRKTPNFIYYTYYI